MTEFWDTLGQLIANLGMLLGMLLALAGRWALLLAWVAWWLFAVDWRQAWSVLARGAWAPALLIAVIAAFVWTRIEPGNFWGHLGGVGALAAVALLCGWLQGVFGIKPADISVEPIVVHDRGHEHPVGTLHGHEFAHSDDPRPEQAH